MTAESDFLDKQDNLRAIVREEQEHLHLDSISVPSVVKKVLEFDYSFLDTLGLKDLEKHMGSLSQYLIYINKYINQVKIAQVSAQDEYKKTLNVAILAVDRTKYKTISEKEMEAEQSEQVKILRSYVDKLNARIAMHKNIPESITNLIQTVKKVYDSRIREKLTPND